MSFVLRIENALAMIAAHLAVQFWAGAAAFWTYEAWVTLAHLVAYTLAVQRTGTDKSLVWMPFFSVRAP